jgi:hypothetical protein
VSFVEECTETRATGKSYYPNSTHVSWVYSGTFPSDPLRVYLVDCYAYMGLSTWVGPNHNYQSFPQEFMFDLLAKIYEVRAKPNDSSKLKDTKYYLDKLAEYENKGEGYGFGYGSGVRSDAGGASNVPIPHWTPPRPSHQDNASKIDRRLLTTVGFRSRRR